MTQVRGQVRLTGCLEHNDRRLRKVQGGQIRGRRRARDSNPLPSSARAVIWARRHRKGKEQIKGAVIPAQPPTTARSLTHGRVRSRSMGTTPPPSNPRCSSPLLHQAFCFASQVPIRFIKPSVHSCSSIMAFVYLLIVLLSVQEKEEFGQCMVGYSLTIVWSEKLAGTPSHVRDVVSITMTNVPKSCLLQPAGLQIVSNPQARVITSPMDVELVPIINTVITNKMVAVFFISLPPLYVFSADRLYLHVTLLAACLVVVRVCRGSSTATSLHIP